MGYYVQIESSTFTLPSKHYDEAYKAMCALNKFDNIKRGGSYHKDPDTGVVTENKWFSWMLEDYPDHFDDPIAIFEELGFSLNVNDSGLEIWGYDNKTGQEDLFLEACCPWASGEIYWLGESSDRWMDNYDHMTVRRYTTSNEWILDKEYAGAMAEAMNYAAWKEEYRAKIRSEEGK